MVTTNTISQRQKEHWEVYLGQIWKFLISLPLLFLCSRLSPMAKPNWTGSWEKVIWMCAWRRGRWIFVGQPAASTTCSLSFNPHATLWSSTIVIIKQFFIQGTKTKEFREHVHSYIVDLVIQSSLLTPESMHITITTTITTSTTITITIHTHTGVHKLFMRNILKIIEN